MYDESSPRADSAATLRAVLTRRLRQARGEGEAPIPRSGAVEAPLTFAQHRMWVTQQMAPESAAYLMPCAFRLAGPLETAALREAVAGLVHRHEALRTTFHAGADGTPVQRVEPWAGFETPVHDLSGLDAPTREAIVARHVADEGRLTFDLERGLPFRAALLRLGPAEHVLLLTFHHLVCDGWSLGLLFRDLAGLYGAFARGAPPPAAAPAPRYADYAAWQREHLQGDALERHLAYWREQLAGASPRLALIADRERPPVHSQRGAVCAAALSPGAAEGVQALARAEGATPFMVHLAAFAVLLSRYGAGGDLTVGTPLAGRTRPELAEVVGLFVNTLPLRARLDGDPDFRGLLRRMRPQVLGVQAHAEVPFDGTLDALGVERSMAFTPFVQATLVMAEPAAETLALPGLSATPLEAAGHTAKFDLSLVAADDGALRLEYATDLFDAATAERLLEHHALLVERLVGAPDRPLSRVSPLTPGEEAAFCAAAAAVTDQPVRECLHQGFAAHAARTPHAVAVTCEGRSLTYAELDARANRLARYLRRLGVGPEARVGVCLERSLELVVALLGVLKAGGAYVPLDPTYPVERLAYLLADSAASLVVTDGALAGRLPAGAARLVCLDLDHARLQAEPAGPPEDPTGPAGLAYVIYTSGSTGRPKGVMVEHRQAVRLFRAARAEFAFGQDDVWSLFHSVSFDYSVWEIWGALLYGGRLVVVPFATTRSSAAFLELLEREGVTVLSQTPSAFRLLAEADGEAAAAGRAPKLALRCITFAGEALDPQMLRPWIARRGDEAPVLGNMYGITETTVHVTWRRMTRADCQRGASSPIGPALRDLGLYLLDPHGAPAPDGAAGEMWVGGAGVARGYLGRPALTADRFRPDPFSPAAGARMYRSGDRARRRADGDTEYLGRIDHQVKVRGFRVEPGEVEAVLAAHPGVRAALVAPYGAPGDARLVAWVVAGTPAPDVAELRAHLRARLPEPLVPAGFVLLDAFPLTANGKVDRAALPPPDFAPARRTAAAPRTPRQALLAGLWAEALGVGEVGIHDGFFELGGDSIRSIRLLTRLRERGWRLDLTELVLHPTVAEAAERLVPAEEAEGEDGKDAPFSLVSPADRSRMPEGVEDAYPLACLQTGMSFYTEVSGNALYHYIASHQVRAPYDEARLRRVVQAAAARHPVLRTSFHLAGFGEPLQLVHREVPVPMAFDDLGHLDEAEQEAAIDRWIAAERAHPFRLDQAPLWRVHVHRRGPDGFNLGLVKHHAILDGWSAEVLVAELLQRYGAGGDADDEPPLRSTYREFVAAERAALASGADRAFWEARLAGATPGRLPRGAASGGPAPRENHALTLAEEDTAALRRTAAAAGLPLRGVLLAAHLRVMAALTGERDVMTAVVMHGRPERADGDRVLGLFLNSVPLRLRLRDDERWEELAVRAERAEREIFPFRRFPLAELQRMNGGEPWCEALFHVVDFHGAYKGGAPGVELVAERGNTESSFPLTVTFDLGLFPGRVHLLLTCDRDRLPPAEAAALRDAYGEALRQLGAGPGARVFAAPLASAAERARLARWGDGGPGNGDGAVHALFAAQARRTPDAVALEWAGGRATYAELDAWSTRLADAFAARGVGRGDRVGVCLQRSGEQVAVLLGVLKAGAGYVACEPEHPDPRAAALLRDAGAALLVTRTGIAGPAACAAAPVLRLDEGAEAPSTAAVRPASAGPGDLAYVAYTSGSTGTPRGVAVPHRAVVRLVRGGGHAATGPDRVFFHHAPVAFDASTVEIWCPLLTGGRLVVAPPGAMSPDAIAEAVRRHGVTTLHLTTSLFNLVVDRCPEALAPLREVLSGGEEASPTHLRRAAAAWPGLRVLHCYGPTENTTFTTCHPLSPADRAGERVPIGRPVGGTRCHVLDEWLHPVPAGMPGELFAGGEGVADGYPGRPALTAERFLPDPFAETPGARMYRTGDRVCWRGDGALEFLGRTDGQVKIRGTRVEPGEVEAALRGCPGVREAVVDARGDGAAGRRLVAWVVAAPGAAPAPAELRAALRRTLPEAMVPAAIQVVESIPLAPSGKVDRAALPEPWGDEAERAATPPRDEVEAAVCAIWREVLERPVGVEDDFFDVGGDSLRVMRLVPRLREVFRVELPLDHFFAARTVAATARALREREAKPDRTLRIARLFLEVAALPEARVEEMLRERRPADAPPPPSPPAPADAADRASANGRHGAAVPAADAAPERAPSPWTGCAEPAEPARPLHALVAEQARLRPDAVAVSCGGVRLTYGELDARAGRLADWLAGAGAGPETVVAVHLPRSPELIVALLAALKAGAAYLGVEPGAPAPRIRALLADAAPRAVLTTGALRDGVAGTDAAVLALDTEWERVERAAPRPAAAVHPESLAYVSYTSGSTGRPRAVAVPHAAVARLVRGPDWAAFGPDDVFLHHSPVAFDASTLEIWGALANGARLAVHRPGPTLPDQLAETLRLEGVTTLWLTAGLFHRMVDDQPAALSGVRHLVAGGDVLSPAHVERLLSAHPGVRLTNGYGPTENTTFTACWSAALPLPPGGVPIGRPVRGTRVAVLDARLDPVPPGEAGELYAAGAGLARGYRGAPGATAARFLPDPHGAEPGARMYRTGDLARRLADGTLQFLGRADRQVKVQGFRVEPGEVEAALARWPGVREAVVVAHADAAGGRHLLGYVVPREGGARGAAGLVRALREALRGELPPHLVPRAIIPLDALPLSPAGKVDRAALPALPRWNRQLRSAYVPPRTELEATLAELWGELLSTEPVGVEDDFFALGGHSLMAAELFTALERALGVDIPARTLYLQSTIASLAAVIEERRAAAPAQEAGR